MEKGTVYLFSKRFKIDVSGDLERDLQGKLFSIISETSNYYIVEVSGDTIPVMVSKHKVDEDFKTGKIIPYDKTQEN